MRGDQRVVHVLGVARGIANAPKPVDFRELPDQSPEAPFPAIRAETVIGVDVLAKQGDFAGARGDQPAGFRLDRGGVPRLLGAAGIGHHAERTEPVAAFLHREVWRHARGRGLFRQKIEFDPRPENRCRARARRPAGAPWQPSPAAGDRFAGRRRYRRRAPGRGFPRPPPGPRSRQPPAASGRRASPFLPVGCAAGQARNTPCRPLFRGYGTCSE